MREAVGYKGLKNNRKITKFRHLQKVMVTESLIRGDRLQRVPTVKF